MGLFCFIPIGWNYAVINSIYHSYDLPCLAFFCLGVFLFLDKRLVLFYIIFVVACFNRESTCFITFTIILLFTKTPTKFSIPNLFYTNIYVFRHCIIQFLIWLSTKQFLEYIFRDNPGSFYENLIRSQIFENLWYGIPSWPYLDIERFLGNPRCFLTLFACIWILIPYLWTYTPKQVKKLIWILPIYLIIAFNYANMMETRIYQELNIIISLIIITGIINKIYNPKNVTRA